MIELKSRVIKNEGRNRSEQVKRKGSKIGVQGTKRSEEKEKMEEESKNGGK